MVGIEVRRWNWLRCHGNKESSLIIQYDNAYTKRDWRPYELISDIKLLIFCVTWLIT
jgi:hypothetical protein